MPLGFYKDYTRPSAGLASLELAGLILYITCRIFLSLPVHNLYRPFNIKYNPRRNAEPGTSDPTRTIFVRAHKIIMIAPVYALARMPGMIPPPSTGPQGVYNPLVEIPARWASVRIV